MPINWQDKAVQDRLLVAVIASVDNNVSQHTHPPHHLTIHSHLTQIKPHEIARLYGGSMTYNAVESYLRKFRKEAKEMKGSATDRAAPVPSPARPRKAASVSPKKAAAGNFSCCITDEPGGY
jgi:hypothetical protein